MIKSERQTRILCVSRYTPGWPWRAVTEFVQSCGRTGMCWGRVAPGRATTGHASWFQARPLIWKGGRCCGWRILHIVVTPMHWAGLGILPHTPRTGPPARSRHNALGIVLSNAGWTSTSASPGTNPRPR